MFDVAHNLAKVEEHTVSGSTRRLCVNRKGTTRAFGPGHPDLTEDLRGVGQPVFIPGSMGTASWVLRGVAGNPAFDSAAHGRACDEPDRRQVRGNLLAPSRLPHDALLERPDHILTTDAREQRGISRYGPDDRSVRSPANTTKRYWAEPGVTASR